MKKFQTIDAATLRERLASDDRPVLVNALAREAFEDERIPGSISIPASDAVRVASDILARDQPMPCIAPRAAARPVPRSPRSSWISDSPT